MTSEMMLETCSSGWYLFRCPSCSGELSFGVEFDNGLRFSAKTVPPARMRCTHCEKAYPILNSIPRFISNEGYASSFGFQWNMHSKTQLDSYSGLSISRNRLLETTGWHGDLSGEIVLEAGSGAGRFTEVLLGAGATVYSFDYSDAVEANYRNNGKHPNLTLFQASIDQIPLGAASFDKVICLGVIQHTPDPAVSFRKLAEMVRPGGELVIDCYAKNLPALLHWKYLLRPISKRINKITLYRLLVAVVPWLIPIARFFRQIGGRAGARVVPIIEYSHLGLPPKVNVEWAILDSFDMYSPTHDHPQSVSTIRRWFELAGFAEITVQRGQNGVIGRGRKL